MPGKTAPSAMRAVPRTPQRTGSNLSLTEFPPPQCRDTRLAIGDTSRGAETMTTSRLMAFNQRGRTVRGQANDPSRRWIVGRCVLWAIDQDRNRRPVRWVNGFRHFEPEFTQQHFDGELRLKFGRLVDCETHNLLAHDRRSEFGQLMADEHRPRIQDIGAYRRDDAAIGGADVIDPYAVFVSSEGFPQSKLRLVTFVVALDNRSNSKIPAMAPQVLGKTLSRDWRALQSPSGCRE